MHILYRPYVRCLGAALPAANGRAGASASAAEAGGTGRRSPVFAPVSRCAASQEHRRVKIAPRQFCPFWAQFSVRRNQSRRKALTLFCANAYSQQPAVRAAARVCGFWKLTLFSRFPERFDAKFEKSRRKAPCHNGLRRRSDVKLSRFA